MVWRFKPTDGIYSTKIARKVFGDLNQLNASILLKSLEAYTNPHPQETDRETNIRLGILTFVEHKTPDHQNSWLKLNYQKAGNHLNCYG